MEYLTNKNTNRKYKFSICTPCFNSEDSIEGVFKSIQNLTYNDFEWIIVNDASTDNTAEIIKKIISKTDIDIAFYNLDENRMATYCYNFAVKKSHSDFLILLDHDDMIEPNALDRFLYYWNQISLVEQENLAGMICNCKDENGHLVGTYFPISPYINGFFELIFDDNVRGEKFFCYKTEIMKNNNFPLEDRYVPESTVMWNISAKYKTLFFNEALRIYTRPKQENNHLSFLDSFEYPNGFRFKYLELLNKHSSKFITRPRIFFVFIYNYALYSCASDIRLTAVVKDLGDLIAKVTCLIFYPIAFLKLKRKFSINN